MAGGGKSKTTRRTRRIARAPRTDSQGRRETRVRYWATTGRSDDAVLVADRHGRIVAVNEAACALCDRPEPAFLAASLRDLFPADGASDPALDLPALLEGRLFLADTELIRPDGGRVAVELSSGAAGPGRVQLVLRDITDRKSTEESLRFRREFEKIVASLSSRFLELGAGELNTGIGEVLERIGTFAGVDRCVIFQHSDDGRTVGCTHEWYAPGVASAIGHRQGIEVARSRWFHERVLRNEPIEVPDVDAIPDEASVERERMRQGGVRSLLVVPLVHHGHRLGTLGFEMTTRTRAWPEHHRALLTIVADVLGGAIARGRADQALRYRLQFEQLITSLSTHFINLAPEAIDAGIQEALARVGSFAGVDRCYVFQQRPDGRTIDNTHEWCAAGIAPQIHRLQGLTLDVFPWIFGKLWDLEVAHIPDVEALPPEAAAERAEFDAESIQSLVCVPIAVRGKAIGFVGFDSVRAKRAWPEDQIALLKIVGEIIANALERKQNERELRHRVAFEELVTSISTHFINLDLARVDGEIHQALRRIGEFAGVDRCYICLLHGEGRLGSFSHEWCAPGVAPHAPIWRNMPVDPYDWWWERLRRDGAVRIPSIRDLPDEAAAIRDVAAPRGIRATLGVALTCGGRLIGFLGLTSMTRERAWDDDTVALLKIVGEIFAGALDRRESERRLHESEEQLRQAQKLEAVGRLAGGIAHDFNTLLTAILGYGNLLRNRLGPEDALRRHVDEILSASERAAVLTRQLLAFSRKQVLQPRVLDLNAVVRNLEPILRRVIGEDIELVLELADPLCSVRADLIQIEQVILNLAANARDSMPQGGRLTLATAVAEREVPPSASNGSTWRGPAVRLSVTDTGCGMDEETRARLFEPFFTTKAPGQGTGLGLSTVYGIVRQTGGDIRVESEPGRGTRFEIDLRPSREAATELPRADERAVTRGGTETVLVAEDDRVIRQLAAEVLQMHGYRVLVAGSGEEALRMFRESDGPVELLVTDLVMPGMPGQALARRLRAERPGLRVLYMSGYSEATLHARGGFELDAPFISKPFTPDGFARRVREALEIPAA